jgi:hypothetical protein
MRWVVQTNIFAEEGFAELLAAIERFGLPLTMVKVVPFVGTLELVDGELPEDGADAIVMGSYGLARAAARRGWWPGAFLESLDTERHIACWGAHMLNAGTATTARGIVNAPVTDRFDFGASLRAWMGFTL